MAFVSFLLIVTISPFDCVFYLHSQYEIKKTSSQTYNQPRIFRRTRGDRWRKPYTDFFDANARAQSGTEDKSPDPFLAIEPLFKRDN